MYWNQKRFKRAAPYDPVTNVATIQSAPSYTRFHAYCSVVSDDEPTLQYLNASFVSDDEESVTDDKDTDPDIFPYRLFPTREKMTPAMPDQGLTPDEPDPADFSLDGPQNTNIV
jgi:hypothetical protein